MFRAGLSSARTAARAAGRGGHSGGAMVLTVRKSVAIASGLLAFVSFARVAVLFLEALSAVRDERAQDYELLQLCREGSARGSMKMRAACLQAQADRASPVVLKAVLRAVSIAGDLATRSARRGSSPSSCSLCCPPSSCRSTPGCARSSRRSRCPGQQPRRGAGAGRGGARTAAPGLPAKGGQGARLRRQQSASGDDEDYAHHQLPSDEERPNYMLDIDLADSTYGHHAKWE